MIDKIIEEGILLIFPLELNTRQCARAIGRDVSDIRKLKNQYSDFPRYYNGKIRSLELGIWARKHKSEVRSCWV